MRRKEVLVAAVIGGVVGAILVMAVGSIGPLGAHNEHPPDAEFSEITCRRVRVVDEDDKNRVIISDMGYVMVYGVADDGKVAGTAVMAGSGIGGTFYVSDRDGEMHNAVFEE